MLFTKILFRLCLLCLGFSLLSCAENKIITPPKLKLINPASFEHQEALEPYSKGLSKYEEGDQRQARSEFQRALKKNPRHYPSLLGIAYTYMAEGNLDFAERYAQRALDLQPDYAQAHQLLALIFESRQDYEGALAQLNQVRNLRSDYPGVEQNQNILRLKLVENHLTQARSLADSDPAKALEHFSQARELAPEIPQVLVEMAQLLLNHGNCDEAVPYLREALQQLPGDAEIQVKLADCLAGDEQYEEALQLYQAAMEASPSEELHDKIENVNKKMAFLKMPEEYQEISRSEQVNRGQLAALLVTELPFLQKYNVAGSEIMVDILNHWARSYIQKTVDLGILEAFPNRTFEPYQAISKLDLARAVSRLLQILSTEEKQIPVSAENIDIPDVSSTNVNYPAVSAALSAGVLSLDADGRFHPNRPVSGAEVLSMVNRLKTLAE